MTTNRSWKRSRKFSQRLGLTRKRYGIVQWQDLALERVKVAIADRACNTVEAKQHIVRSVS
jgi:hypothetical protein